MVEYSHHYCTTGLLRNPEQENNIMFGTCNIEFQFHESQECFVTCCESKLVLCSIMVRHWAADCVSGFGTCAQGHCILVLSRPFTMILLVMNQTLEMDTCTMKLSWKPNKMLVVLCNELHVANRQRAILLATLC